MIVILICLLQDHLEGLKEKLRNTEDKLGAAEQCKTLLNDEVTAVQQAHQKMSQDLEVRRNCEHLSVFGLLTARR